MVRKRKKFRYEVCYLKKPMIKRECDFTTSLKNAYALKKILKKEKVWRIEIKKLPKPF